jgi:PAS domain S-box-containing protein
LRGSARVDDRGVTGVVRGVRSELDRLAHWDGLVAELVTAVIVADVAGRAVIWNAAATKLFGWPAADVLGRPVLPLLLADSIAVDAVAVLTDVASGRPWTGEVDCNRQDRSRVPIFLTMSPVYDDDRNVIGFVG